MCITQRQAGHPEAITNFAPYFSFGPFSHVSDVEGEGCNRFSVEVTQLDRHRAVHHIPKELSPSLSMSSLIRSLITQMKSTSPTMVGVKHRDGGGAESLESAACRIGVLLWSPSNW